MKIPSRFFLFLGFLSLNGCMVGKSTYMTQNLWKYAPPKAPKDFHLVLVWKETMNKIHPTRFAHPEWFLETFAQDCSRTDRKLRTYQIVGSMNETHDWVPFWQPGVPTLRADIHFSIHHTTSEWKVDLTALTRYQPFQFDLPPEGKPTQISFTKKVTADDEQNLETLYKWIKANEPQLYQQLSQKLVSNPGLFYKEHTRVWFYPGKSSGMKEAFDLAKKGEWKNAKSIWLKEFEISKNDPVICINLSAASQMLGEWEDAHHYFDLYSQNKPQGFVWLFSGLPIEETFIQMLKGLSLTFKYSKKKNRYNPQSKVAILLLNNITNDLDTPNIIRKAIYKEAVYEKIRTLPLAEIDEQLLQNGYTDGGQLPSTTPQNLGKIVGADLLIMGDAEGYSRGKLNLVHAASGEMIFSKDVRGISHTDFLSGNVKVSKEVERERAHRRLEESNRTGVISEIPEARDLAAQEFFRSWPRLYVK